MIQLIRRQRHLWAIFLIILKIIFPVFTAQDPIQSDGLDDHYAQKFTENFDQIFRLGKRFSSEVLYPFFQRTSTGLNLTLECRRTLNTMFSHPNKEWSTLMFDANGRLLKPGVLSGTITDYGDYDQCLAINIEDPDIHGGHVSGHYCLLSLRPPIPPPGHRLNFNQTAYRNSWTSKWFQDPRYRFYYRLVSGLCFPGQCRPDEIESLARKALENFQLTINVEACQSVEQLNAEPLDWAQKISILILATLTMAVILGTVLEQLWQKTTFTHDGGHRMLLLEICQCFSFLRNTEALFWINDGASQELSPIHGMRFLLIMWVITCHTTNFAPLGLYDQPMIAARFAERINIVKEFWTQFVISGSLSVQAFFIISGLISLHTAMKNRSTFLQSVPYWKYILLRWLRFAPPLLGMFCYQFLWPRLGSGPMMHWDYLHYGHRPCYQSWWANFLFISNWFKLVDQCGSHTWFLSADFQINLFAYFIIWLYVYDFRLGFWLNVATLTISTIMPTLIHWYYGVPLVHILEPDVEKLNQTFNMIEFNTYNHCAAYLTGLLIAGMLQMDHKIHLTKNTRNILWCTSMVLVLLLPFSTYPFIQMEQIPATFLPMIYTGLKRTLWIMAIGWIVYASCSVSKNSLVARFLSARIFQPFSRLTFCIYLTQSLVVWYYAYQSRELHTVSHYNSIFRIGGITLYSLVFGYILYILFEAPSVNICRILFKRHQQLKQQRKHIHMLRMNRLKALDIDFDPDNNNNNNNDSNQNDRPKQQVANITSKTIGSKNREPDDSDTDKTEQLLPNPPNSPLKRCKSQ